MKTFKLKALEVIESKDSDKDITQYQIPLLEGLIINREDENNRWVIEAYIDKKYHAFFTRLKETREEIMIQVKITKQSNAPATFITSIIGMNDVGENMNVLFMGTIVDKQREIVLDMLKKLIDQGYHGEDLLDEFKGLIK
ncbi:MAG TPA: YwpF family protein [Virgibacillus sp.]|nr:YwpF family protein [Virgibacillus sp.]